MRISEIIENGTYVRQYTGRPYIRLVYRIKDDRAYFHEFNLQDGAYVTSHSCTVRNLASEWAERKATQEEVRKLDIKSADRRMDEFIRQAEKEATLREATLDELFEAIRWKIQSNPADDRAL